LVVVEVATLTQHKAEQLPYPNKNNFKNHQWHYTIIQTYIPEGRQ
jgi:hypothetical protein